MAASLGYLEDLDFRHFEMDGGQHAVYCLLCVAVAAEYGWSVVGDDVDFIVKAAAAHIPYCPARAPEMVKEELRHIKGGITR